MLSDRRGEPSSMRFFRTPRLTLRSLTPTDEAVFCRLYTDPATMRYIGQPFTREQASRAFRFALRCTRRRNPERWYLGIDTAEHAEPVGICSIQQIDERRRSAEAGIMIRPEVWAQGYAKEGLAALVNQAFVTGLVDEIWVRISAEHAVVERLVLSVGFSRTERTATGADGMQVDVWSAARGSWSSTTIS